MLSLHHPLSPPSGLTHDFDLYGRNLSLRPPRAGVPCHPPIIGPEPMGAGGRMGDPGHWTYCGWPLEPVAGQASPTCTGANGPLRSFALSGYHDLRRAGGGATAPSLLTIALSRRRFDLTPFRCQRLPLQENLRRRSSSWSHAPSSPLGAIVSTSPGETHRGHWRLGLGLRLKLNGRAPAWDKGALVTP